MRNSAPKSPYLSEECSCLARGPGLAPGLAQPSVRICCGHAYIVTPPGEAGTRRPRWTTQDGSPDDIITPDYESISVISFTLPYITPTGQQASSDADSPCQIDSASQMRTECDHYLALFQQIGQLGCIKDRYMKGEQHVRITIYIKEYHYIEILFVLCNNEMKTFL